MSFEQRFWSKVNCNGPISSAYQNAGPCWLWMGGQNGTGYGLLYVGSRTDGTHRNCLVHRASYELHIGPIPCDREIDHLCRVRNCVNPAHLDLVTRQENARRGIAGAVNGARQLAKTHCPQGHPYAGENLKINVNGRRICRLCSNEASRRYKARKKSAA